MKYLSACLLGLACALTDRHSYCAPHSAKAVSKSLSKARVCFIRPGAFVGSGSLLFVATDGGIWEFCPMAATSATTWYREGMSSKSIMASMAFSCIRATGPFISLSKGSVIYLKIDATSGFWILLQRLPKSERIKGGAISHTQHSMNTIILLIRGLQSFSVCVCRTYRNSSQSCLQKYRLKLDQGNVIGEPPARRIIRRQTYYVPPKRQEFIRSISSRFWLSRY